MNKHGLSISRVCVIIGSKWQSNCDKSCHIPHATRSPPCSAIEQNTALEFPFPLAFRQIDGGQNRGLLMILIDSLRHHQLQGLERLCLAKTAQPIIFTFQFESSRF